MVDVASPRPAKRRAALIIPLGWGIASAINSVLRHLCKMRKQSCAIAVLLVLWGFGLEGVSSDASSSISHHLSPGHIPALRQYKWDATRSRMLGRMKLHLSQVQEGPEKDSSSGVKTRPRSPRFEEERCLSLSCKESPDQESLDVKRDPSGAHLPKPMRALTKSRTCLCWV